jgi:hypothetical protein
MMGAVLSYWWFAVPVAAEVFWSFAFLPRAWRFYYRPGGWWVDADGQPDDWPPTLDADLFWREVFVLYHMPGVAAVSVVDRVVPVFRSFWSMPAVMAVTGGLYAALLLTVARHS